MPGTVPVLVYCQYIQSRQPAGSGGIDTEYAAIQSWSAEKAVLLPVHVFHQSAVE